MHKVQVKSKQEIKEPRQENLKKKCSEWLDIDLGKAEVIDCYLIDMNLSASDIKEVKNKLLIDPVAQEPTSLSSKEFDWIVRVGFKPGVKDNEGERATNAIKELLGKDISGSVHTSTEYLVTGDLTREEAREIAQELLANELINSMEVKTKAEALEEEEEAPRVDLSPETEVKRFETEKESLKEISENRNLALSQGDLKVIGDYFRSEEVKKERELVDLPSKITDVELEAIAQSQSEHCKHKIFNGKIRYRNKDNGQEEIIDSLFDSYIKESTSQIDPDWILSVFWDNAGIIEFNEDYAISMKFETHNSPSGKEPYGGAITGIVGVYRDLMGAGKGSRLIAGSYGYCTPSPLYDGDLKPEIKPKRLLEGIVEGVRDGGNKSGVPTIFGYSKYDNSFLGKPLVYVGAIGLMPKDSKGEKCWKKDVEDGDLIMMVGGRVGRDGIHGVTESSMEFGEQITAGHVQIGDPFTQKKVHDFLLEARDKGLYKLTWDCGGGGLSSAVGETAEFSNGCQIELDKVPLKYEGLEPWEILVSESQERMILGVGPKKCGELEKLAKKHDVEVTEIGKYRNNGKFHATWRGTSVAYLDIDFLHEGFPQLELEAEWSPEEREKQEIELEKDQEAVLKEMLRRPNIACKEWIQRQYDHEVQGNSVIKPLVGEDQDVDSDASVIKPLDDSKSGLALSLGNCFKYSKIDPYWMAACSLDEAIRRVLAVGASLDRIALNDNFCWPNSLYDPKTNPEGKENLGALVRANKALYRFTTAFETPCISGKDSMFIDGNLKDENGEIQKVSGTPALQFAALGRVDDVEKCIDLSLKEEGDLIYIIGETKDELGASELYEMENRVGERVPKVEEKALRIYKAIEESNDKELLSSCHGCYRGGMIVALAKKCFAGKLGVKIDLEEVPSSLDKDHKILYSESPSRFLVSIKPEKKEAFENVLDGKNIEWSKIGKAKGENLVVRGLEGKKIIDKPVKVLKKKWKSAFKNF